MIARCAKISSDKKCNKCGGTIEYRIRLEKSENNAVEHYDVFECVDCGRFEWRPTITSRLNQ